MVGLAQRVEERPPDFPPHPGDLPIAQATPAGHPAPATHLLGEHLPLDAGAEHKQDAGQRLAMVDWLAPGASYKLIPVQDYAPP